MTSSKYQIWLEAGKKKHQLPVNPESIKIQRNGNNQSVTLPDLEKLPYYKNPKPLRFHFRPFSPRRISPAVL